MEGVKRLYRWLINDQEERNKVREISGNEYPGECCIFKEFFGAQSDGNSMVLSKVMQKKKSLISSMPRRAKRTVISQGKPGKQWVQGRKVR